MNLKEIRKKNNITQLKVSEDLKIPRSTYNGYEQKVSEPNIETIIKLAKYFNVTTDELLGIENKEINLTEKNNLLKTINKLTEIECYKLNVFAEGLISNRVEQKDKIYKIIKED